ncbi:LOW QUALITY PROTEIN: polyadenylate-binding protein 2-like [Leucoraja erinacea]|uniref:LOW QUALITY PROTEIN: polyadenylate-binding protein 2-like n=1 Tax=Leucoraja erinaceus TaxID=7782 RepID=UPI0024557C5D|nr:LOW QUALITY PROTEIN: polyadenylate-binding protein 2-like [Leucoraja erinacea]
MAAAAAAAEFGNGADESLLEEPHRGLDESGDGATTDGMDDSAMIEDPELEAIKARVREMEEEAEKLKELQNEVEEAEADEHEPPSLWDYGATAEELEAHFHGCGSVNRVTILCDKYTGHPRGDFAYIEFSDKESVRTAMALDDSLFRGRQIKVVLKRTNRPGISTTDRGWPRTRFRARASYSSRARFYSGYVPRARGRAFRSRGRSSSWYSPYYLPGRVFSPPPPLVQGPGDST